MRLFDIIWSRMSLISCIILLPWSLIDPKEFQYYLTVPSLFFVLILQDVVIWIQEYSIDKYKRTMNETGD